MSENKPRVLIVDDEPSIRHVLQRIFEMNRCETRLAASAEEGAELLRDWEPAVALLDIVLPGKSGIDFLIDLKKLWPDCQVLVITSNSSAETALQAVRRGAFDYLPKPFANPPAVWATVQRALENRKLALKNRTLLEERQERNRQLSSTVGPPGAAQESAELDSLAEILDSFLDIVTQELEVDRASLMLLDADSGELRIGATRGILEDDDLKGLRVRPGEGIAGKVAQTGEPFLVSHATGDPRVGSCAAPGLSSSFISTPIVLSVPIKSAREVFGVINVTHRRSGQPFNTDNVAYLSGMAGQLGTVIANAKQSDQLRKAYESLKATQHQLVFSERIKAVGQMAAGVAHDFNNALSVILARAEFAMLKLARGEPADAIRADLQMIVKTSLQGAETIRRIQDYTRIRRDTPSGPVDLNDVVRDAVEFARPKWKEQAEALGLRVDVQFDLQDVPQVSGNVHELTQVVGNLIFNAVEAMPSGGTLTFRSRAEDDRVILEVADSGIGMDPETCQRLFEPFFTTKESGQGLGTSIIFGIVSRHGGRISVESQPGKGSTFRVELPRVRTGACVPTTAAAPGEASFVKARVLLVDDDVLVRETHAEALLTGGHEVVPAAGGTEALSLCRKQTFDLVITDLSMTGMTGLELAREIKRMRPDLPIILFSGWAIQELEAKVKSAGIDRILVKPCLIHDLLAAVQTALRAAVPTGS